VINWSCNLCLEINPRWKTGCEFSKRNAVSAASGAMKPEDDSDEGVVSELRLDIADDRTERKTEVRRADQDGEPWTRGGCCKMACGDGMPVEMRQRIV